MTDDVIVEGSLSCFFLCFVFNQVCIQICSSDYACLERMAEESKFGQSGTKPSDVSARV